MEPAGRETGVRLPIDYFFRSLAEDQAEKSICILLSGSGSDGTLGLRAIKEAGGLTMVQSAEQAQYSAMPFSAIATGMVDHVLPVEKMPQELVGYIKHPYIGGKISPGEQFLQGMQKIFMIVRSKTGHDFTNYKQNTIRRRVERRMAVHKIVNIKEYVRLLQEERAEVEALFRDLVISVTNFFRDPEAFEILYRTVIHTIVERKPENGLVRVWVPGCATGEEAYSIAILMSEVMDSMRKQLNVQIFATDIDTNAIEQARLGEYPESISADVTPERVVKFFTKKDDSLQIKKSIREMVVFAEQNLISDPPFSRLDLISCRNLLIYLGPVLQKKLMPLFHYTLNPDGFLFLGSSETVGEYAGLFKPIEAKWKIFQKKGASVQPMPEQFAALPPEREPIALALRPAGREISVRELAERMILEDYAPPSVFVDESFDIVYFQGATERYLSPPKGEPSFNVLKMARNNLRFPLTSALHKAVTQEKPVVTADLQVQQPDGAYRAINLIVRPVVFPVSKRKLIMIVFEEKPREISVGEANKPERTKTEMPRIQSLEQELQSTKEYLQTTIEELEASNEELKSANEELQSTNEELQSTNEELETSKEELQSTNEELVTVNAELQNKVEELARANADMNNLLAGTEIGNIFLDNDLRIKRFTPAITRVFNLIPGDVGRPISDITAKISVPNLARDARKVLETLQTTKTEVRAEDGAWYSVRMAPYRSVENMIEGIFISFIDVSENKRLEQEAERARTYAESIVETIREPLMVLDGELRVVSANRAFYRTFKTNPQDTMSRKIYALGNRQWDIPSLRKLLEEVIPQNQSLDDFEVTWDFQGVGRKKMLLNARMISEQDGQQPPLILLAIEDMTEKK